MSRTHRGQNAAALARGLAALAVGAALCACATPGATRPARIEIGEDGFTITEEERIGVGARADFSDAVALLEGERYAEGVALLEEVTREAPHATAAHINLAIAHRGLEDLESAEASLLRAHALNERHPVVYNEMGILYRRMGRFAEARESYERALEVHPGFHFARRNLAILCDLYLADHACALRHYELYTEAVPEDAEAAMWIADLRKRAGG